MDGLPEPMAPIVPDLHGSPGAGPMFQARRSQQQQGAPIISTAPAVTTGQRVVTGGAPRFVSNPASAPAAAPQTAQRQIAPDVAMKEAARPTVTMPSLEDVSTALSGIELAKQLPSDPKEIHKRFIALLARNPPIADVMKSIDNTALQMNCPPPLIRPRTPDRRVPGKYTLSAYSAHAPASAARVVPQYKQTVLDHPHSGTNIKRYLRMGKPANPQFTYQPPSRPASRATSAGAGAHRSRSPPVNARQVGSGAEGNADATGDETHTIRKRCGCCMQEWDFRTGMSKLRYCPRCEKMRWQLRQNGGGRVQHLRDAIGDLGASASVQEVVSLALKKAHPNGVGANEPAKQPAQQMTLAQGPTLGSLTGDKRDPAGSGSGAEGTGKQAAPLSTMPSAEDIDNMAALLAGKPADGDDQPQPPPQKRPAITIQKDCDICRQTFMWKSDSSVSCCENCEQLKIRTKAAGYTASELRKGITTGYIIPQMLHTAEEVRRLLGNMMLGRPRDSAPQSRAGRRPARDRSAPAEPKPPAELQNDAAIQTVTTVPEGEIGASPNAAATAHGAMPTSAAVDTALEKQQVHDVEMKSAD